VLELVQIPSYVQCMHKCLRIQGRYSCERAHVLQLIQPVQLGVLKLGKGAGLTDVRRFTLDDFEEAIATAVRQPGFGAVSVFDLTVRIQQGCIHEHHMPRSM
jgi:hypothetical protein